MMFEFMIKKMYAIDPFEHETSVRGLQDMVKILKKREKCVATSGPVS